MDKTYCFFLLFVISPLCISWSPSEHSKNLKKTSLMSVDWEPVVQRGIDGLQEDNSYKYGIFTGEWPAFAPESAKKLENSIAIPSLERISPLNARIRRQSPEANRAKAIATAEQAKAEAAAAAAQAKALAASDRAKNRAAAKEARARARAAAAAAKAKAAANAAEAKARAAANAAEAKAKAAAAVAEANAAAARARAG